MFHLRLLAALPTTFGFFLLSQPLAAQLRLARVFGDHMVLQRDQSLRIWGVASPEERVTVRFNGEQADAIALQDGTFTVWLPPMSASAKGLELTVTGRQTVRLVDLLIGDVWLCSGQSNMAMGLHSCNAAEDIANADLPQIRYRPYFEHFAGEPQDDLKAVADWRVMKPSTAADCTAVGFYFARAVQPVAAVPIGLLTCAVGGTEIECWMPPAAFAEYPANQAIGVERTRRVAEWQESLAKAIPQIDSWLFGARTAAALGAWIKAPPLLPIHPNEDREHWHRTQSLYNGMVHPLGRFAICGVLWYQGESNADEETAYVHKFTALIEQWRKLFLRELPFYYVQLPNFGTVTDKAAGGDLGFAPCRMAQLTCTRLPKTGMAVTIDIGLGGDLHPPNKRDVGLRLARFALANEYQQPMDPSGPLFARCERDGEAMRVHFDHSGKGLQCGGKVDGKSSSEESVIALRGFAIASADRQWYWAEATIDGATVIVHCKDVPAPVAVRYAFTANPEGCNLYNNAGLPASPFRSDTW